MEKREPQAKLFAERPAVGKEGGNPTIGGGVTKPRGKKWKGRKRFNFQKPRLHAPQEAYLAKQVPATNKKPIP